MTAYDPLFVRPLPIVFSVRLRMTTSNPLFVRLLPIVLSLRLRMMASDPLFVRFIPIVLSVRLRMTVFIYYRYYIIQQLYVLSSLSITDTI
jgi:hypothetical protein